MERSLEDMYSEFTSYSDVKNINDSTKFEYVIDENIYGGELNRELRIKK